MYARLLFFCIIGFVSFNYSASSTVNVRDVQYIYLFKNKRTTGEKPMDQLICRAIRSMCDDYAPDKVTCENLSFLKEDLPKWNCEDDLPFYIGFEHLDVNCERDKNSSNYYDIIEGIGFGLTILMLACVLCTNHFCPSCGGSGYGYRSRYHSSIHSSSHSYGGGSTSFGTSGGNATASFR